MKKLRAYFSAFLLVFAITLVNGCSDTITGVNKVPPTLDVTSPKSKDTVAYGQIPIAYTVSSENVMKNLNVLYKGQWQKTFQVVDNKLPSIYLTVDSASIGQRVSYFVTAVDVGDNVATSSVFDSIYVVFTKLLPSPVTSIRLQRITDVLINVMWEDTSSITTGYEVWRKIEAKGNWEKIYTFPKRTYFNINDTLAYAEQIRYYKIGSVNANGTAFSAEVSTFGSGGSVNVLAPSNLTCQALGTSTVLLNWKDNSNNESYFQIERSSSDENNFGIIKQLPPNTTTYTDSASGLTADRQYLYRVKVVIPYDSAWSRSVAVRTLPYNLLAPTNLAAVKINQTTARVSWKSNSIGDALSLKIERRVAPYQSFQPVGTTTVYSPYYWDDTTISSPNTYTYRAYVTDGTNSSPYSSTFTLQCDAVAPTGFMGIALPQRKVQLMWNDAAVNEINYIVERRQYTAWTTIATLAPNSTQCIDSTGLTAGQEYYYRVKIVTANDFAWTSEIKVVPILGVVNAPTNLLATASGMNKISLTWNDNSDNEVSYVIERSSPYSAYTRIAALSANSTSYDDTPVYPPGVNNQFTYRVKAIASFDSATSNEASSVVRVALNAPTNLALQKISGTAVKVTWTNNLSLSNVSVQIERQLDNSTFIPVATGISSIPTNPPTIDGMYQDNTLTTAGTYRYRVRITDGYGYSAYTAVSEVTMP
ncbi:MAG: fibronectin type III domain-containing protein [Ignavibacteria bacterium]|nr:fibronectin type III domain-containing protein [Ignavibacteria bacterium]